MKGLVALITVLMTISGCSVTFRTGPSRVAPEGAPYSYEVPSGFSVPTGVSAGSSSGAETYEGSVNIDEFNGITVVVYPHDVSIDELDLAEVEKELDRAFEELGAKAVVYSKAGSVTIAGAPAFVYRMTGLRVDDTLVDEEIYVLLKGKNELEIMCQWTEAHKADMARGCQRVRDTFRFRA